MELLCFCIRLFHRWVKINGPEALMLELWEVHSNSPYSFLEIRGVEDMLIKVIPYVMSGLYISWKDCFFLEHASKYLSRMYAELKKKNQPRTVTPHSLDPYPRE